MFLTTKFQAVFLFLSLSIIGCLREPLPGTTPIEQPSGTSKISQFEVSTVSPGKIAFSYQDSQSNQIYIMNADGSNRNLLVNSNRNINVHGFSPNGQNILTSENDSGNTIVGTSKTFYLGKLDTQSGVFKNEIITLPNHASQLIKWLPDNSGFVYVDTNRELYEYRLQTGNNRKLLSNEKIIDFEISPLFGTGSTPGNIKIAVITEKPNTNRTSPSIREEEAPRFPNTPTASNLILLQLDNLQTRTLIQTPQSHIIQIEWGIQVSQSPFPSSQNNEALLFVVGTGIDPQDTFAGQTLYKIRIDQAGQARPFLRNGSKILKARVSGDSKKISILATSEVNPSAPIHFFQTVDFEGRILSEFKRQNYNVDLENIDIKWMDDAGNTLIYIEKDHVYSINSTGQNQVRLF